MKVADLMQKNVDYVTVDMTVEKVSRLIFGRGINGVPVCKDGKIVGFISERDILAQFYPSVQEYAEDWFHAGNFEEMEEKLSTIFNLTADKIMARSPITVTAETPLLRAQSMMFIHKVGRLPVIDEKGNLIGILSKGDIFRALVGKKIPCIEDEEYHDWLSKYYDMVIKWKTRLGFEIRDLASLFRKEKIQKVLDVGSGTGEHVIALAKEGFETTGIERSVFMAKTSREKWEKLPEETKKRVEFIKGDYIETLKDRQEEFGAAIFMGNALAHNPHDFKKVLETVSKSLRSKNALIIIQIVNFEKVLKTNKRLQDFNIYESTVAHEEELAFVEFYDPPKKRNGPLTLNMAIFHFDDERWAPRAFNNTPIANLNKENIKPILAKLGFAKISFYGSMLWSPLFKEPFKPLESDWLNVIAKR